MEHFRVAICGEESRVIQVTLHRSHPGASIEVTTKTGKSLN
jgi:hypothetical protein